MIVQKRFICSVYSDLFVVQNVNRIEPRGFPSGEQSENQTESDRNGEADNRRPERNIGRGDHLNQNR